MKQVKDLFKAIKKKLEYKCNGNVRSVYKIIYTVLILEKHQYIIHNQRTKDFQIKSFVLFFYIQ